MPTPSTPPAMDFDSRLRLAAFDALRKLTEPVGGVITRDQMTAGFEFEGSHIAFADRGRGIWRPRQLGADGAALAVVTAAVRPGEEPPYDDGLSNDEGWLAYRYQRNGSNSWDNVALRNAFQAGRPIIYFQGIVSGVYSAEFPMYVVEDDSSSQTFRLASVGATLTDPTTLLEGSSDIVKSYMLRHVKTRLHQNLFRERVVRAYRWRCAVCRLHHSELLDAAHILEDKDERGKPEVANGLALCKIHHGAYDANIMGIDPERRIHIREDILDEVDGPMLRHGLQEMHGELIHVPGREILKPRREYLEERFERFRAA